MRRKQQKYIAVWRGVILHKLMEQLLTGELEALPVAVEDRAGELLDQLTVATFSTSSPDPAKLARTALRTLTLPELNAVSKRIVPEVPVYGTASKGDARISGRADAIAWAEDGSCVVFDWKSDVAPKHADRISHQQQLSQYLHLTGAKRGAIVYMTSGTVDWVSAPA